MVSTAMQGGCVCENCSYLRQGTGNIELAGLFAPKPLGMSGANDWTIDIEAQGTAGAEGALSDSTAPRTASWRSASRSSRTTTTRSAAR